MARLDWNSSDLFGDKDELEQYMDEYRRQVGDERIRSVTSWQPLVDPEDYWFTLDNYVILLTAFWAFYVLYKLARNYRHKHRRYHQLVNKINNPTQENIQLFTINQLKSTLT